MSFFMIADESTKADSPQLTEEEDYSDKECIDELIICHLLGKNVNE